VSVKTGQVHKFSQDSPKLFMKTQNEIRIILWFKAVITLLTRISIRMLVLLSLSLTIPGQQHKFPIDDILLLSHGASSFG